jgi:hypothetical protein
MRAHERQSDDRTRRREERRADAAAAPADAVLALQRSAGNHAVAGMLARDKDDKPPPDATSVTSQLGDLGVIPLDSASWDSDGKNVQIMFADGPLTTRVMDAMVKARPLDPAWISTPAMKSTMTGALIATAQASGPGGGHGGSVQATINFEKVDHDFVKR